MAKALLTVTAFGEAGTGLLLLAMPAVVLRILLSAETTAQQSLVVARVLGAALLALGASCWLARGDRGSSSYRGLLAGMLVYAVAAAAILAYAGAFQGMIGIALWPAVAVHLALAAWTIGSLLRSPAATGLVDER
jgi:hypothetical protein